MKKKVAILLITACMISQPLRAKAEEPADLKLMNATAYCTGHTTATGKAVREGLCATDRAHLGNDWCAIIYQAVPDGSGGYKPGERLWILECEDTGPEESPVVKGYTIDIYRTDLERCQEVMNKVYENGARGKVFVQYIQAQG